MAKRSDPEPMSTSGSIVMWWTAGLGLWAAAWVFSGRLRVTVVPSRTSRAAPTTCAGSRWCSAPRWSCSPQRPQVLTASNSARNSLALTSSVLPPWSSVMA
jgi:hypothetical protein